MVVAAAEEPPLGGRGFEALVADAAVTAAHTALLHSEGSEKR